MFGLGNGFSNKKGNGMKSSTRLLAALVVGTLAGAGLSSVVLAQTMNKAAVEKIVQAYIADHGDELMASISRAMIDKQQAKAKDMITADTPVKGPADAAVTIIEFSDFQCPYCDAVQKTLSTLRERYKGKVRWAFKNMPLEFHPRATPAALAGIAAQKQGKFWEFSRIVWANQADLGKPDFLENTARQVGMDVKQFNADRASDAAKAKLERDLADARASEVRGTPFFLINGQPISGALPLDTFAKVIDAELAKANAR